MRDFEAVKSLGMRMVAVTWGYTSSEHLASHAPDHLVQAPSPSPTR